MGTGGRRDDWSVRVVTAPLIFRSRIDPWIGGVLVVATVAQLVAAALLAFAEIPGRWIVVPSLLIGPALILWVLATTCYVIYGSELLVRCGPLRLQIPLSEISSIQKARNPLSSPALSLDRLVISYGSGRRCMISPRDQARFLEALRAHGVRAA